MNGLRPSALSPIESPYARNILSLRNHKVDDIESQRDTYEG